MISTIMTMQVMMTAVTKMAAAAISSEELPYSVLPPSSDGPPENK